MILKAVVLLGGGIDMTEAALQLQRLVERAAEGKPYLVQSSDEGFDLSMDLADDHWVEKFHAGGLSHFMTWHVKVDEDGSYTILDDQRSVEWGAGVLGIGGRFERSVGHFSPRRKVRWEFEDGRLRKVSDEVVGGEGRALITRAAKELGLRQRMHWIVKVALVIGAATLLGLVVAALVVVWMVVAGTP